MTRVVVALLVSLAACTPPSGGLADLEVVTGFRVSPTFNAFSRPCDIRYTLQEPALVQIRVTRAQPDGQRVLVRQITQERRETAGSRTAAWRGIGPNGLFAPQGEYVVELYARLEGGTSETWELTTVMFRT
ncbi:hypothetical protein [Rubrivirga sp.]|uniref:hypothetical protein n=1 Tax=Rubrivirga sp. TaxID=1885344 RepID=UPI003C70B8F6